MERDDDTITTRPATHSPEYLIDDILPSNEVHLLGGPSGSGKTTWLFQEFDDNWRPGGEILGKAVHPVPFVYVAADRSHRGVERTLRRAKIKFANVPYLSLVSRPEIKSIPALVTALHKDRPELKLFIIDGVMRLIPTRQDRNTDGGFAHISNYLVGLNKFCEDKEITLLLIVHSPKQRDDSRYLNPRERVMGSIAWAAHTETVILVEPSFPMDRTNAHHRTLICLPRNYGAIFKNLEFNEAGRLVARGDAETTQAEIDEMIVEYFLKQLSEDVTFTTQDFLKACGQTMSRASMFRILKELETKGRIIKVSHGVWRKTKLN